MPQALAMSPAAEPVLRSEVTRVRDINMHARVAIEPGTEDRTPVVLIHGFVLASRVMAPSGQFLARDFPVYAPDLPGFGESDKPPVQTLDELTEWIEAWLEARGIARAAFIGNSMGCELIINLAVAHPHRIARIVLQGPSVDPPARSYDGMAGRLMKNMIKERSSALNEIAREDYARATIPRVVKTAFMTFRDEPEKKLPRISAPVLVVRAGNDPVISQEWAERCASIVPDGRLIVIPGYCHTIHFIAPEVFTDAIRPFLLEGERELRVAASLG
jgi:2-hydroxy-6-oxonona-2,4-dienedioate hydrolase